VTESWIFTAYHIAAACTNDPSKVGIAFNGLVLLRPPSFK